jgi:hypothetical protein
MNDSLAYGPAPRRRGVIRRHAKAFAIGTAIAILTTAGIGIAVWLIDVTGTGYAKVGSATAPTIEVPATGEIAGTLSPGETGTLKINNQNAGAVPLTLVAFIPTSPNPIVTFAPGTTGPCSSANFHITSQPSLNINIPPLTTTIVEVSNAISMDAAAPIGCQGATLAVPGTVSFST